MAQCPGVRQFDEYSTTYCRNQVDAPAEFCSDCLSKRPYSQWLVRLEAKSRECEQLTEENERLEGEVQELLTVNQKIERLTEERDTAREARETDRRALIAADKLADWWERTYGDGNGLPGVVSDFRNLRPATHAPEPPDSDRRRMERAEARAETAERDLAAAREALERAEHVEGEFSRLVERLSRLPQGREMTVSEFAWEVSRARSAAAKGATQESGDGCS